MTAGIYRLRSAGSFTTISISTMPAGGACSFACVRYFPFSARVCLNQHHWLANRMREEKIDFQQCSNAFLKCSDPKRLQEMADLLSAKDLLTCGRKWLA